MFKKASAAVLAVLIMAVMLAGCGKVDAAKAALTINGETVSSGTASTYTRYQQAETYSQMKNYGLIEDGSEYWNMIYDEETNQTYGAFLMEAVKEDLTKMVLLRQHAGEFNITLTDEENAAITEAAAKFVADNGSVAKWIGADQASVENLLSLYTYQAKMYDPMTADVDREVSDEEAAHSTMIYFRYPLKMPEDYEGTEEEYKADAMEAMKSLLDLAKAADLTAEDEEAEAEAEPAETEEDAEEEAEEEITITDVISSNVSQYSEIASGLSEDIYVTSYSFGKDEDHGLMNDAVEAVSGLSDGEFYDGVIETDDYLYLAKMEAVFDEDATENEKQTIISEREQTAYDEKLQSWKDAATITVEKGFEQINVTDRESYVIK